MADPLAVNNEASPLDKYDVSVKALRQKTRDLLSALLNPRKIILTDDGLARDWNGLADLTGIKGELIPSMRCGMDPTKKILNSWYEKDKKGSTIKQLLIYLEELDRFDVIDDARPLFDEDIKAFQQNSLQTLSNLDADKYILTRDDVKRIESGLEPQKYDAFVLFADDDADFATTVLDKMENQYDLKLCAKDRDLIVGVFEHDSIIELIADRCNRLVVIISQSFLDSSSNKFFYRFAQSLGLEQQRRKIVPVLYTQCKVPPELSCYFMLDYRRSHKLTNFWERLNEAIKITSVRNKEQNMQRSVSQQLRPIEESKEDSSVNSSLDYENANNSLKPKKERVKFSSMINLNHPESDSVVIDENLNPVTSASSLTVTATDTKKNKTKTRWLKKLLPLLPHKSEKMSHSGIPVIKEIPEQHIKKVGFFTKHTKRKVALAN